MAVQEESTGSEMAVQSAHSLRWRLLPAGTRGPGRTPEEAEPTLQYASREGAAEPGLGWALPYGPGLAPPVPGAVARTERWGREKANRAPRGVRRGTGDGGGVAVSRGGQAHANGHGKGWEGANRTNAGIHGQLLPRGEGLESIQLAWEGWEARWQAAYELSPRGRWLGRAAGRGAGSAQRTSGEVNPRPQARAGAGHQGAGAQHMAHTGVQQSPAATASQWAGHRGG